MLIVSTVLQVVPVNKRCRVALLQALRRINVIGEQRQVTIEHIPHQLRQRPIIRRELTWGRISYNTRTRTRKVMRHNNAHLSVVVGVNSRLARGGPPWQLASNVGRVPC